MPDAIEPQLDELRRRARRRLVGAVVLALAAAVLVPMLLESDPKPLGEDVSVKIPPVDDGKFVSKLGEKSRAAESAPAPVAKSAPAPTSTDAATAASAKDATTPKRPSPEAAPAGPSPTAKPTIKEAPAPAVKDSPPAGEAPSAPQPPAAPTKPASEAAPSTPTDAVKGTKTPAAAFSVQLAAFADDKGANALVNRLKKAGHPAYTEPYTTSRGTLWRVRVGPYVSREAAETARTKLKADGQNGIIAATN
jgi:DedD protein